MNQKLKNYHVARISNLSLHLRVQSWCTSGVPPASPKTLCFYRWNTRLVFHNYSLSAGYLTLTLDLDLKTIFDTVRNQYLKLVTNVHRSAVLIAYVASRKSLSFYRQNMIKDKCRRDEKFTG